jgi:hypothetical protein
MTAFFDMKIDSSSAALDEVEAILQTMRTQESTKYRRVDYLSARPDLVDVVDGAWRQRIIEWQYGVVDHCNLRRDSVAVAAYYLDLCLAKDLISSRTEFQLAAMTALSLAIKMFDTTQVRLDSLVKLGRGLFNENDVVEMEAKMLRALDWHVHPPTPVCFLRQLLRLLPDSISPLTRYVLAEVTRFICEISVCLYKFVRYPPSAIAFAGMLIAMDRVESGLSSWERQEIMSRLQGIAGLYTNSPEVVQVLAELKQSLDNNMNLQELIKTIGAQCHDGYTKLQQSREHAPANPVGQPSSPRDVADRKFR